MPGTDSCRRGHFHTGVKGGNAAIFRQNDRRFRNYIMAWQKKGTHPVQFEAYRMIGALSHWSGFARHYYAPVTTLRERDEGM